MLEEVGASVCVGDFFFREGACAGADEERAQTFAFFDLIASTLEVFDGFHKGHGGVSCAFFACAGAFDPVRADTVDKCALFEDGGDQEVALDAEGCGDTTTIMDIEIGDSGGDDLVVLVENGVMQECEVEGGNRLHEDGSYQADQGVKTRIKCRRDRAERVDDSAQEDRVNLMLRLLEKRYVCLWP